jgi:hypothetical protein
VRERVIQMNAQRYTKITSSPPNNKHTPSLNCTHKSNTKRQKECVLIVFVFGIHYVVFYTAFFARRERHTTTYAFLLRTTNHHPPASDKSAMIRKESSGPVCTLVAYAKFADSFTTPLLSHTPFMAKSS